MRRKVIELRDEYLLLFLHVKFHLNRSHDCSFRHSNQYFVALCFGTVLQYFNFFSILRWHHTTFLPSIRRNRQILRSSEAFFILIWCCLDTRPLYSILVFFCITISLITFGLFLFRLARRLNVRCISAKLVNWVFLGNIRNVSTNAKPSLCHLGQDWWTRSVCLRTLVRRWSP